MSGSNKIEGARALNSPPSKRLKFEDGDWYQNPKARPGRLQLNSLSKEARQVYACIELATMGYGQELAVITEAGNKQRPLTTTDIGRLTELDAGTVRRAMRELEDQQMAERRPVDDGPLRKGKVEIYSTANPPAPNKNAKRGRACPQFPAWFPDSWETLKAFINRERRRLPANFEVARALVSRGEEVARNLENAQNEARAFLEEVCAHTENPLDIRKKESERNSERNIEASSSSSGLSSVDSGTTTTPIPETPTQPAESPASLDPLPKIIYDAFSACVKKPFSRNSAKPRVADARRVAAKLGEPLSDKDIADCIRIFEADPKKVDSIGFYIKTLPEKVEALLEFRQRERDDAADRARAGWVCPECNGYGLVTRVVRGLGATERCICQQQAKGA